LSRKWQALYFNPRSPCGERHSAPQSSIRPGKISIHAPRAGSDAGSGAIEVGGGDFNPRSPCGERPAARSRPAISSNFNPRSPCGERHSMGRGVQVVIPFQSTLPVRGATFPFRGVILRDNKFQSTLPVRGATLFKGLEISPIFISIHAPRAGSDDRFQGLISVLPYFNPRSPCGERQMNGRLPGLLTLFQSTLPVRGATYVFFRADTIFGISIHAPRAGSDSTGRLRYGR